MAQQLESEEITVGILLRASLVERREILRSMGLRFGQIMSLNQALEHRKQGAAAEGGGAAEEAAAAAAAAAAAEEEEEEEEEEQQQQQPPPRSRARRRPAPRPHGIARPPRSSPRWATRLRRRR